MVQATADDILIQYPQVEVELPYKTAQPGESSIQVVFALYVVRQGWGVLNQGLGLRSQFPLFHYFLNFSALSKCWLLNIMFIIDRCHRSWAAETPVKYECDLKNLIGTFAWLKILLAEKLMNGALETPTPGQLFSIYLQSKNDVSIMMPDFLTTQFYFLLLQNNTNPEKNWDTDMYSSWILG